MAEKASVVISAVDQATEVIKRITGEFSSLQSSVGKLSAALGIGAGAVYLTSLVKNSIEAADRMGELSQITGVGIKTLSGLSLAAKTAGLDIESVAGTLGRMNKNLSGIEEQGSNAAEGLAMLGINAEKFKASKVEDRLFVLADALKDVDNSTGEASRALDLIVKGGSALIPMLSGGSEGLREMMDTAEALGLVLDENTAAAADRVADAMTILGQVTTGVGNRIMQAILPTLEGLSKAMLDAAKSGGALQIAIDGVVIVFKSLVSVGAVVWTTLKQVGGILGAVAAAATLAVQGQFAAAVDILKQGFVDAGKAAEDNGKFIHDLWTNQLPQLTEAEGKLARAIAGRATERKKATAEDKEALKFAKELEAAWQKFQEQVRSQNVADAKRLQSLTENNAQMRFEIALIGKTREEIVKLEQARIDDAVAILEQALAGEKANEQNEITIQNYEREIKLLKEKRDLLAGRAAAESEVEQRESAKRAAEDAQNEWQRAADQIEQSLTDALVQGFEGGKSFMRSVGDYIVNYFKTTIARGIAQALMGAIGAGLSSQAGASGLGSLLGGSGGGGGGLGGLGSLLGGGLSMGSWGGLGFLGGVSSTMTGAASMGGFAGLLANGSYSAAAGMAAPYVAAAYGLYRLISGVGTGRSRGPAYQEWSTLGPLSQMFAGGINNPGGGSWQGGHYDAQINALLQTVSTAAKALGGSANSRTSYGLYSAQSPDGRGANTISAVVGASGNPLAWIEQSGGNADVAQLLAQQFPAMIRAGLLDSDLPKSIKDYIEAFPVVDQTSLDRMIASATAAQQMADAFEDLGGPFAQLTDMTVEARLGILELTGGLDAFASKMQGYYSEFYSQEERAALSLVEAQRTLQGAGIDTSGLRDRASYRSLVDSINPATNPEQFAALINAAGAFASGSDLLGMSGMSLRDFTAGAPGLELAMDPIVTAQDATNTLLASVVTAIYETSAQVVAAIGNQQIAVNVQTNQPSAVEVGYYGGGLTGGGN